jgi:hypothetical protein
VLVQLKANLLESTAFRRGEDPRRSSRHRLPFWLYWRCWVMGVGLVWDVDGVLMTIGEGRLGNLGGLPMA